MKLKNIILLFFALLSFSLIAQRAQVKIDTNAILIGEQVKLDIQYELPIDRKALFPVFRDTLTSKIEIINQTLVDTILSEDSGIQKLHQQLIITAFDTGYFVIPSLPFGYLQDGDTAVAFIKSDPLLMNVFTVEVDTTKDIKPIVRPMAQPYTIDEFLPWILFAFALAVVIFAIFYFVKRRKKNKPLFKKKEKPALPAHEQAFLDLDELKRKKLWQNDRLKEYHSELSEIVRVYIEGRFEIPAVEMVSHDIIEELNKTSVNKEIIGKLHATIELSDLVKFAKSGASALENDTCWNNCLDFIQETKQEAIIKEIKEETEVVDV